jgi:ribosomal protein L29|tara:strand:- start:45 stop:245 length:201 start_codon:yes stop_codon:yes gene_type:complete
MKWLDIKNLGEQEVRKALTQSRSELVDLRFKVSSGALKQVREIRTVKKSIAKLLTRLGQLDKKDSK